MSRKVRRAINFDLSIDLLKEYYNAETPKNAYKELRSFFCQEGFTHRQGSGYISVDPLSDTAVVNLCKKMKKELPWLEKCAKKMDLTNIGSMHNILKYMEHINLDSDVQQMSLQDFGIDLDMLNQSIENVLETEDLPDMDIGMEL